MKIFFTIFVLLTQVSKKLAHSDETIARSVSEAEGRIGKGKGKGKVHPITGHEGIEVK